MMNSKFRHSVLRKAVNVIEKQNLKNVKKEIIV